MISIKEYGRVPERDWKGVKVRSLKPIKNGWGEMPEGSIFTIRGKQAGFSLRSDPCPCCGFRFSVSRVDPYFLERVNEKL